MMTTGKIEEGCLARVVNNLPCNNGIIVTVGRFIGKLFPRKYKGGTIISVGVDYWEVDALIQPWTNAPFPVPAEYRIRGVHLQRIDEGDLTEEELAEEEGLVLISDMTDKGEE